MPLTFGTGRINAVHATFNSVWKLLLHAYSGSRHTEILAESQLVASCNLQPRSNYNPSSRTNQFPDEKVKNN